MKRLFLAFALLTYLTTFAQNSDVGAWYIYFGSIKPENTKWSFEPEVQYRNHNLGGDLQQLLVRPVLKYQLLPNLTAGAGYAYVLTEAEDTPNNPNRENRIHQEAILSQNAGRLFFRHRFRYEQRFVEDKDFNTRYRYCLFVDIPINKPTLSANTIYVALYNEIFINGKRNEDTPAVFDRNRLYLGAGYRFSKNLAIQAGWMNQMLEKSSKSQLMLSLHHNLPIRQSRSGSQEHVRD